MNDNPDFWVDLNVETSVRINPVIYSSGYGGGKSEMYTTPTGKLYVDLLDTSQKHIIWEAVASTKVDRTHKNSLSIVKAIKKIFKEFPG